MRNPALAAAAIANDATPLPPKSTNECQNSGRVSHVGCWRRFGITDQATAVSDAAIAPEITRSTSMRGPRIAAVENSASGLQQLPHTMANAPRAGLTVCNDDAYAFIAQSQPGKSAAKSGSATRTRVATAAASAPAAKNGAAANIMEQK